MLESRAMIHIEFAVVVALLVWILFRMAVPWRADMIYALLFKKLNRIEAHLRGVPVEQIDRELAMELEDIESSERGRPWFGSRPWEFPHLWR